MAIKLEVPASMRAWVLDAPHQLRLTEKPVPMPGAAEVLVHVDAVALCGSDIEVIASGSPAMIEGGAPFGKNWTPGHEYMGRVAKLGAGVDEYRVGDRVAVEVHAGCGRCERCRMGMYTSCLNYGMNYAGHNKGHRANGFTTDGGFAQYAVNHVNTLVPVPDDMSDEEATLIVTGGTAIYAIDTLGGLVAGESLVVIGAGPVGLMCVALAKSLGADPVILIEMRDTRLKLGLKLGADHAVNVSGENPVEAVIRLTGGKGAHYVIECSGAPEVLNQALAMVNRGGSICLAAFPHQPVMIDALRLVSDNISLYGIRGEGRSGTRRAVALMKQKRFDAKLIHTHTFSFEDLPTAVRYARDRVEDAIKVVVKVRDDTGLKA
jgi:threonine dehydrogenase-like Zn-dependent dehydrogenase